MEKTTDDSGDFLTIPEVAKRLGVSRQRCYVLAAEGVIPSVRLTERRIRIPRGAWEAYIRAQESRAVEAMTMVGGPPG